MGDAVVSRSVDTFAPRREVRRVRRRPKDRKAQIARAAGEMFNERGYHGTSMQDVADRVGVSAPALYRHFPNKYAMFASATVSLLKDSVDRTAVVENLPGQEVAADPRAVFDVLLRGLIDTTMANRRAGGIYRWRARHLDNVDLGRVTALLMTLQRRIDRPLSMLRPDVSNEQRAILQWGVFSVAGSVIDHETTLPPDDAFRLLADAAHAVVTADLPEPGDVDIPVPDVPQTFGFTPDSYEDLVRRSLIEFGRRGYAATSVADLAEVNEVSVTELYRHFRAKADILTGGMRWLAERLAAATRDTIAAHAGDPRTALVELVKTSTERVFAYPELAEVYFTEQASLEPDDQRAQAAIRRAVRDDWVGLLTAARPELDTYRARFLVHAAADMAPDLCRVLGHNRYDEDGRPDGRSAYLQACMRILMERTLLGEVS